MLIVGIIGFVPSLSWTWSATADTRRTTHAITNSGCSAKRRASARARASNVARSSTGAEGVAARRGECGAHDTASSDESLPASPTSSR